LSVLRHQVFAKLFLSHRLKISHVLRTILSRPCLSNGRAYGMTVVSPSVRPSVCQSRVYAYCGKRCEKKPRLLLITNQKSHVSF